MSSPAVDEVLYAYIVVTLHAVSLVLIRDDNDLQRPVYYVSKLLYIRPRLDTYPWRRLYWLWSMLHRSFPIISKPTQWLF